MSECCKNNMKPLQLKEGVNLWMCYCTECDNSIPWRYTSEYAAVRAFMDKIKDKKNEESTPS